MRLLNFSQKGFSLVEVLVSLVILAIGLIALVGMQGSSLSMNQRNMLAEVGKDILVSEIDKIIPLSNLELHTSSNVGDSDTRASLGSPYSSTLFSGVDDSTPTDFDYVRWKGVSRNISENSTGGAGAQIDYVVKIAIDEKYLLQDVLARGTVTVYWPSSVRNVDFLESTFFTQRK